MYERYRDEFHALLEETPQGELPSDAADRHSDIKGYVPTKNAFFGFAISDGYEVRGTKYLTTRLDRLTNPAYPSVGDYIVTNDDEAGGTVASAECRNPQGTPDVIGLNSGHGGCSVIVRVFRKF